MLSVGRELNISGKTVSCHACAWEGEGVDLSAGLVPVVSTGIYVYFYRCPACGSFDINLKAKVLHFRSPFAARDKQAGDPSVLALNGSRDREGKTWRW